MFGDLENLCSNLSLSLSLFAAIVWTVGARDCKLVFQVSIWLTDILLCITGKKSACWNYKQKFTDSFGFTIDSTPSKNIVVVCHGFVLCISEGQESQKDFFK